MNEFIKRIITSIILIPIVFVIVLKGSIYFYFFLIICFFISIYEWNKMVNKINFKIFGFIFLFLSFFSTYLLREHNPCCNNFHEGLRVFLITIIICIFTDIGGYLFGKFFKGPSLTSISPNKTYSGMLGSFLLSFISIIIFNKIYFHKYEFSIHLFIFIFLISLISQIGDIIISYFKRQSGVKDTGKIIPGHGGILDRIDGMIFAFPSSYIIYIYLIKI